MSPEQSKLQSKMQTWAKSFKKRDPAIDILKGIAIILMVYAHAFPWCIYFLRLYIPMIFLVVSGYCQKSQISSFSEWKRYMLGKVKSIYVPCAVCNGIFALLGGLFLRIHFYTDDPAFLEMTKSWPYPQRLYTVNGIGAKGAMSIMSSPVRLVNSFQSIDTPLDCPRKSLGGTF